MKIYSIIFTVVTLLFHSAQAESLSSVETIKCLFLNGSFTSLEKDNFSTKKTKDSMEVTLTNIDLKTSTARLIGNAGKEEVNVVSGLPGTLSFVEITPSGRVNTLTVYSRINNMGNVAVYSRHTGSVSPLNSSIDPTISQYFGTCKKLD
jgi:hypothetical protein